ncbi:DUF6950 family protein [Alteriqipengyuania lutimaris]|nr:hypothetical protein [Alteriqipengyuania lutimaris]MBB3034062.1 hypothetical protein [Alteriqipengyuania lutimaris]
MPDLLRRQHATEATLAKYRERPLDWASRTTCVHMARFHLRQMGHRPPPMPDIRSALGARRALKKRRWDDVAAMLDAVLPGARIAPLAMLLGDLAVVRGDQGLDAILLHAGNEALGWHENGSRIVPMIVHEYVGAWRV